MKTTEVVLIVTVAALVAANIVVIKQLHDVKTDVSKVQPDIEQVVSDIQAVVDKIKGLFG